MTVNVNYRYAATLAGGFFEQYGSTLSGIFVGGGANRRRAAQALHAKGLKAYRELMLTLDGATAGSAAAASQGRIANSTELGGKRTIETETFIDANSAAGDIVRIDADISAFSSTIGASPPANLDGNPLGTR